MYRLYAVHAMDLEISQGENTVKEEKESFFTNGFRCLFHFPRGETKRGTVLNVQCHFPLNMKYNLGGLGQN